MSRERCRLGCLTVALTALVVLSPGPASAQSFPPVGSEFQVSVSGGAEPAVAAHSDGGYVVAWRSGTNVVARRVDASGQPLGAELTANVSPAFAETPAVAAGGDGGFLVAWRASSGAGIVARRFDAAGQPMGGEIPVNSATSGAQSRPRVAAGSRGYVVVWLSGAQVVARLFHPDATPIRELVVWPQGTDADVAMTPSGFVAASSHGAVVRAHLFDAGGNLVTHVLVDDTPLGPQGTFRPRARVAADATGAFTVSWWLYHTVFFNGLLHTYEHGTFLRRYDPAGVGRGPVTRANVFHLGFQGEGTVAVSPGGRILSAWTSWPQMECDFAPPCDPVPPQDGSGAGIFARFFDATGNDLSGEVAVNTTTFHHQRNPAAASGHDSTALVTWADLGRNAIYARRYGHLLDPARLEVDTAPSATADGNGVLEPGERAVIAPAWRNLSDSAQSLVSFALLEGPPGPAYETLDNYAEFGVVPRGATASCAGTGNCFVAGASGARPALHWDAELDEQVVPVSLLGLHSRAMHIGDSFGDVPRSSPFYRFVETVYHHDVLTACLPGSFCPLVPVTRETMAPAVMKAARPGFTPPACVAGAERFADVPASSPYCPWIEELARRRVVAGCGGTSYCPQAAVSRETMAVYLLLTKEGTGYVPQACTTPVFADVPATSPFCRWIEELARRGIVGGCGGGNYCPFLSVARDQMSVFVGGTFGLLLYAP